MLFKMVRGWNSGLRQSKIMRKYGGTEATHLTRAFDKGYWRKIIPLKKLSELKGMKIGANENVLTMGLECDWLLRFYCNMNT